MNEEDIDIAVRGGHISRARVFSQSETSPEGKPLLVMLFGGGWVVGSLEQQEDNCRSWVKSHGGVAVAIEHR